MLALSVTLVSCIPMWSMALWMALSPLPSRWKAQRSWLRFPAVASVVAMGVIGMVGTVWAGGTVIGPHQAGRDAVLAVWAVMQTSWIAAIAVVTKSWEVPGAASFSRPPGSLGLPILLLCGAPAAVLAALSTVPATGAGTALDWLALSASVAAIVTTLLSVLRAASSRRKHGAERRGDANTDG